MNPFDYDPFSQEPEAERVPTQQEESSPYQPPIAESEPYHGEGAGRKESPYASSPYVMHHQPESSWESHGPQPGQEQPRQYHPSFESPKPPKAKKSRNGTGKKILALVLAVAVVAGSCVFTASVVNNRWETRMYETEKHFDAKLQELQKQIDDTKAAQSALYGGSAAAGELMSPAQVYASCARSVVAISSTIQSSGYYGTTTGTSTGSGFILTEDGYVITNFHVVNGASKISVITYDGTEHSATLIGSDSTNDIAVLKVEASGLPAASIGSSNDLIVGDMVVAIGNPLGELTSTQTVGYVSGKDRDVTTDGRIISMIQTDAAINSGNSGGPLFNMQGQVVGVTTAKYSGTSGSGASIEGIGFAIPIDDVYSIINDLMDYGYVTGAYLGIIVSDTDEQSAAMFGLPIGAYVKSVTKGYAAERAGIHEKDIIIDLGGHKVTGITSLSRALRNFKAGDTTMITVVRSGARMELPITLDEKPHTTETDSTQPG